MIQLGFNNIDRFDYNKNLNKYYDKINIYIKK